MKNSLKDLEHNNSLIGFAIRESDIIWRTKQMFDVGKSVPVETKSYVESTKQSYWACDQTMKGHIGYKNVTKNKKGYKVPTPPPPQ